MNNDQGNPTPADEGIGVLVKGCARCGQDHRVVMYLLPGQRVVVDGNEMTHYAQCPNTAAPILVRQLETMTPADLLASITGIRFNTRVRFNIVEGETEGDNG